MRYALIGCGRISKNHIISAIKNNLEIVAICDLDISKLKSCSKTFQLAENVNFYTNYKDMIDNEDLDIIAIATDSGSHASIAVECLKRSINLIIEKPIALSIYEADLIIEMAKEKNLKVTVCFQNRFNEAVQKLKYSLSNNELGKLSHGSLNVRWNRGREYYEQADWRGKWETDGGALMNQSIHGIDLICWLFDYKLEEVYGVIRSFFHPYIETEDLGLAILKFKEGQVATIEGTVNVYPSNLEETLLIFGETGTVKIGGKSANLIEYWNVMNSDFDGNLVEMTENIYGNGHTRLYSDFIDSVRRNREPLITAIDGKKALEVVLTIYKSQLTNKPIKFPIGDFDIKLMKGNFEKK